MIIKNITEQTLPLATNILPLKKNNVFSIKIDKSIEIVVVPNFGTKNSHQPNVGIILEEVKILKILSKRYKSVSITTITSKKDLEKFTDIILNEIKRALKRGDRVELRGFGVFSTNTQKARLSRNPKTGEKVNTPEKKTIHFKMSKDLFKKLNNEEE